MDQSGRQAGRRADSQADRQAGRQSRARQGRAGQGRAGQTLTTSTAGHTCPAWSLFTQRNQNPTLFLLRIISGDSLGKIGIPTQPPLKHVSGALSCVWILGLTLWNEHRVNDLKIRQEG